MNKTMAECLEVMEGKISACEANKWQALAIFLRQLALQRGIDLDIVIEPVIQPRKDQMEAEIPFREQQKSVETLVDGINAKEPKQTEAEVEEDIGFIRRFLGR